MSCPGRKPNFVRLRAGLRGGDGSATNGSESGASLSGSAGSIVSDSRHPSLLRLNDESSFGHLGAIFYLARNRTPDLFPVQRTAQQTPAWHRRWDYRRHSSADHQDIVVRILTGTHPTKPLFRDDSYRDDR